jgi:hypothetical protein
LASEHFKLLARLASVYKKLIRYLVSVKTDPRPSVCVNDDGIDDMDNGDDDGEDDAD